MAKARRSQIQSMAEDMSRETNGYLPAWCIKFAGRHRLTDDFMFAIRMPVTDSWELLYISPKYMAAKCIPTEVMNKLDYWVYMHELMQKARDFMPMNDDLMPITPEEKAVFGVRTGKNNPSFPFKGRSSGSNSLTNTEPWY